MKAIWVLDYEIFIWGSGCVGLREEEEMVVDPGMTKNKLDGVGLTKYIRNSCFSGIPNRIPDYQLSTFLTASGVPNMIHSGPLLFWTGPHVSSSSDIRETAIVVTSKRPVRLKHPGSHFFLDNCFSAPYLPWKLKVLACFSHVWQWYSLRSALEISDVEPAWPVTQEEVLEDGKRRGLCSESLTDNPS